MSFIDFLKTEAFKNLDATNHQPDLQGWMDPNLTTLVQTALEPVPKDIPLVIIEVGTWKGKSAIMMGNICRDQGFKNASIVTVDTWLGAPEFWTHGLNGIERDLFRVNGYPSVFYTFTKNVKQQGLESIIAPFPISSIQGAHVLTYYQVKADLIYVDAAHEYDAVLADLRAYLPLLKHTGVLCGDDYSNAWPGVMKAVNQFAQETNMILTVTGVVWSLKQSPKAHIL